MPDSTAAERRQWVEDVSWRRDGHSCQAAWVTLRPKPIYKRNLTFVSEPHQTTNMTIASTDSQQPARTSPLRSEAILILAFFVDANAPWMKTQVAVGVDAHYPPKIQHQVACVFNGLRLAS
jgi:hypothetical protein